jgi:hypothetical protein
MGSARSIVLAASLSAMAPGARGQVFTQSFGNVPQLPSLGWDMINRSIPAGSTGWFQGNYDVMLSHSSGGYIAANYNSAQLNPNLDAAISNWLIMPTMTVMNGDSLVFYSAVAPGSDYPDRLQVRLSLNGSSNDVGTDANSVGDFSILLLDINPRMDSRGYADEWTQYIVTVSGVGGAVQGRLAFRYFVPTESVDLGNYIGIDTVSYFRGAPPPCYANCDGSSTPPVLNANDFQCFLSRFAARDPYANCDGSTAPPVFTANDFQCFLNSYVRGCD